MPPADLVKQKQIVEYHIEIPVSPNDVTLKLNMSVYIAPVSQSDVTLKLNMSVYLFHCN